MDSAAAYRKLGVVGTPKLEEENLRAEKVFMT